MAPTVADAATIKDQTNKEIDDVLQLVSEFNKVDEAATRRKKVDFMTNYLTTYKMNLIGDKK